MPGTNMPQRRGKQSAQSITESDLAQKEMGDNQLQGDDQANVRNQRRAVPGAKKDPDDNPIETFRKADKDERARRDLGKGQGVHPRYKPRERTDDAND